jgi:hypothetical protein
MKAAFAAFFYFSRMKFALLLSFSGLLLFSCYNYQSCHSFPKAFKTVEEAEYRLNTTECESFYDSTSFGLGNLKHAAFYTCDKKLGYLILTWQGKKQVYRNLPLQYWKNMRKANSFEAYFRQNVQFRFPVYLEGKR